MKNRIAIFIYVLCLVGKIKAQDSAIVFRLWGVNADYVLNSYQESYAVISFSANKGAINGALSGQYFSFHLSYQNETNFSPRINRMKQAIFLSSIGSITNIKTTPRSRMYFNYGWKAGISKSQKSVIQNTNGTYDVKYQNKLYIGMPLDIQMMMFSKKPMAISIHIYTHLQRNIEYGAGVKLLWGKYYLKKR